MEQSLSIGLSQYIYSNINLDFGNMLISLTLILGSLWLPLGALGFRNDVTERLEQMEAEMKVMKERIEKAETELREVDRLEKVVDTLQSENRKMVGQLSHATQQIVVLERRIRTGERRTLSFFKTKCGKESINENMKPREEKRNKPERIKRLLESGIVTTTKSPPVSPRKVGFFAITSTHQDNLGTGQTVLFQNVITNIGNGLDPNTSVFRAPVDGLYFISATIVSDVKKLLRCAIVFNGKEMTYMFSYDTVTYSSGSNSVVLQMAANDDVWIRVVLDAGVHVHGYAWSSFSGFLIS